MAFFEINKVQIDGISSCVPKAQKNYEDVNHLLDEKEYSLFVKATGIQSARKANLDMTTSDYAFHAADRLLTDMGVNKNEIDLLVFVSQSPDYIIPMTSCVLQCRLGLPKSCIAFDVTSGCSGYIQGLSIVASFLEAGKLKRALLLVGDTNNDDLISKNDKTTYPLFGAAASATLLSYNPVALPMYFEMGTDGSGADAIMIRDGGGRHPFSTDSLREQKISVGVARNNCQLILNGQDVFSFAISEVPDSIERLYKHFDLHFGQTDYFIFHQANQMILQTIADILEIPLTKIPMSLKDFGNTSSASIPLTIVTELGSIVKPTTLCLCGFGVGLSWGSLYLNVEKIYCYPLIEL